MGEIQQVLPVEIADRDPAALGRIQDRAHLGRSQEFTCRRLIFGRAYIRNLIGLLNCRSRRRLHHCPEVQLRHTDAKPTSARKIISTIAIPQGFAFRSRPAHPIPGRPPSRFLDYARIFEKANGFNIVTIAQAGRLQYEAVLLAASLRNSDPDFAGRLFVAQPNPAHSGRTTPESMTRPSCRRWTIWGLRSSALTIGFSVTPILMATRPRRWLPCQG